MRRTRLLGRLLSIVTLSLSAIAPAATLAQPQTPAGQAGAAAPVRVGGSIRMPKRTKVVEAVYPAAAARANITGVVILELTIGTNGKAVNGRVLAGDPLLAPAALDAARQWEYEPTLLNGVPTPVILTVTVNFNPAHDRAMAADRAAEAAALREPFLLALGRAGAFQVGMSVDDVYRRVPREQTQLIDLQEEGGFTPAIAIRLEPDRYSAGITATFEQRPDRGWIITGLDVTDPRFRTSDGLGVRSTLAEIHAVEPDVQPEFSEHGPVVILASRGMRLLLDPGEGQRGGAIAETAVVTHVLLDGTPIPAPGRPNR